MARSGVWVWLPVGIRRGVSLIAGAVGRRQSNRKAVASYLWTSCRLQISDYGSLTFQDHLGDGLLGGVGKREGDMSCAQPGGEFGGLAVESNGRATSGLARDFDVAPAYTVVPSGAERFHGGLLGGKAGGVTLDPVGFGIAVADLALGEYAVEEPVAVAGQGERNARDFRDVDAGANNHERYVSTIARELPLHGGSGCTSETPLPTFDIGIPRQWLPPAKSPMRRQRQAMRSGGRPGPGRDACRAGPH